MSEENKERTEEEFKPAIIISVSNTGKNKLDTAPLAKEVLVNLLADALKLLAMKPNNVVKVPKGLSAGAVKNFINRHRNKKSGSFGGIIR